MQIDEPSKVFEITFTVDKQAALRAGKSRWGEVRVTIDPAELNDAERAILATGIDRLPWAGGRPGTGIIYHPGSKPPSYAECSPETVRDAIRAAGETIEWHDRRMAERRAQREAEEQERAEKLIAELLPSAPMSLVRSWGREPADDHSDWQLRSMPDAVLRDPRIADHVAAALRAAAATSCLPPRAVPAVFMRKPVSAERSLGIPPRRSLNELPSVTTRPSCSPSFSRRRCARISTCVQGDP